MPVKSQATTGLRLILRQIERYQQRRCTCDPVDEESGAFCIPCTAEGALQELLDSAEQELAYIEEVLSDRPRRRGLGVTGLFLKFLLAKAALPTPAASAPNGLAQVEMIIAQGAQLRANRLTLGRELT